MDASTTECIIIGAGPAGLSAAMQIAARGHSCTVIEGNVSGGHIVVTAAIMDYPGIETISGYAFSAILLKQAQSNGVAVKTGHKAISLIRTGQNRYTVNLDDGTALSSQCVVLATGLRSVNTGLPEESDFSGRGVSYCAECDGFFFKNKPVAIYGKGDGFAEAVESLSLIGKPTYHVYPSGSPSADATGSTFEGWRIAALEGDGNLSAIHLESNDRKQKRKIEVEGLFVYMGKEPADELLKPFLTTDAVTNMRPLSYHDLARTGLFVSGHLAEAETLIEVCASGVSTAGQVSKYLQKIEKG